MEIRWSEEKNALLMETRKVSFEQVEEEIHRGAFAGPERNPARDGQWRIVVNLDGYPCVVPFVLEEDGSWFLKTIYPSRKMKGRI